MKSVSVPVALVAALALSACQTVVVNSHRDSSAGKLAFKRSLAIVNFTGYEDSEQIRRAGEMALVNDLAELNLVPSYRYFSIEELADIDEVKRRASAEGFDGLVLLWVKDVRTQRGLEDQQPWVDVRVSAAIVSLSEDRDLWNGVIERREDDGTKKDVSAIVRAVSRQLKAEGLVD